MKNANIQTFNNKPYRENLQMANKTGNDETMPSTSGVEMPEKGKIRAQLATITISLVKVSQLDSYAIIKINRAQNDLLQFPTKSKS